MMLPPLRELVLRQLVLPADAAAAMASILAGADDAAWLLWLGPAAIHACGADPDRLADIIDQDIATLDEMIGEAVERVLHHPLLQRMEGRWRGLYWLAEQAQDTRKLRLLTASWTEIAADLDGATAAQPGGRYSETENRSPIDVSNTSLYAHIYQNHFNQAGGVPFSMLVIDHEIRLHPDPPDVTDDIATLEALAVLAEAAFMLTVVGASPGLLQDGVSAAGFGALAGVEDPAEVFANPSHARLRRLRRLEQARFIAMVAPRLIARAPWPADAGRNGGFRYCEHAPDAAARVWMMAGYAFASVVLRAMATYGWPADICGADTGRRGGGVVTGLPVEPFRFGAAFALPRLPLDVVWLESQERAFREGQEHGLVQAGILPLAPRPFGEEPVFAASRSLYQPPPPTTRGEDVFADSRVASRINSVLCASRFAHAIKIRGRNMIGGQTTAQKIQDGLWTWVKDYVNGAQSGGSAELRAQTPLLEAKVKVDEQLAAPGTFSCALTLKPYYQLETLGAEFRFETELKEPRP